MKQQTLKKGAMGGIIALSLMTAAPFPKAEAATLPALQAQIQALLAQIQALQSQTANSPGACFQFTANLTMGSSGTEVTNLQKFLLGRGHAIPAGATGYFGEQTKTALSQFQSQNGITPAIGYFGPLTRNKVNAMCAAQPQPAPGTGNNNGGDNSDGQSPLGGEAVFENFNVFSGDETNLEEGQKNVSIMEVKFDVEDGDAVVNRIDLGFRPENANEEKRPWRVFSEVAIYKDGDRIARIDASNKSHWKENNPTSGNYMLRLSGINWIVEEGDTAEFTVHVATANSLKGISDGEVWNVFVLDNGIRALDAKKGVLYTGNGADSVTVDIDESGSRDELILKRSDDDPNATTLRLKSSTRSGYLEVFAFDLDTDDSKNDIEIRKLPVQLTVGTGTATTFVRDARLIIDGKTYTKKTVTTDGVTQTLIFDFGRNEFVIDAGDRTTVVVEVEFNPLPVNHEGVTFFGSATVSGIRAEGADDLSGNQLSGSATGETHTLRTKGFVAEAGVLTSTVTSVDGTTNDYATYSIPVKVTAFGQDVYVPTNVAEAVTYQLEDGSGAALSDTGTAILTSNAREENGYFRIREGETKTLTLDVIYQPGAAMTAARLQLLSIGFNDTAAAPNQTWNALPASSYETSVKTIVN